MTTRTKAVCIKVPKRTSVDREIYDALKGDAGENRRAWYGRCCDVYVGRPKCDGGWYHVPQVKKGSIFCNPYTLKEYNIRESLELYEHYLRLRLVPTTAVEELIAVCPEGLQKYLRIRYIQKKKNAAKSVAHYELEVVGDAFRQRLLALRGLRLGCWCEDPVNQCHAGVLARLIDELCSSGQAVGKAAVASENNTGCSGLEGQQVVKTKKHPPAEASFDTKPKAVTKRKTAPVASDDTKPKAVAKKRKTAPPEVQPATKQNRSKSGTNTEKKKKPSKPSNTSSREYAYAPKDLGTNKSNKKTDKADSLLDETAKATLKPPKTKIEKTEHAVGKHSSTQEKSKPKKSANLMSYIKKLKDD